MRFSGQRLKAQRLAAGQSRESVAVAIDRSYHAVVAYERDRVEPPANVLGDLAEVLKCSPADFYDSPARWCRDR